MARGAPDAARSQTRTYDRATSIVFLRTKERYGGLSNMAAGYPLRVNGLRVLTSEALYQACRFPHLPDLQRTIIAQRSPMTAKMKSKPFRHQSRPDWNRVRVGIMRWCLRVKLAQHQATFGGLLLSTGDWAIVEESRKDDFWGAKPVNGHRLVGVNALGRLLMELRELVRSEPPENLAHVERLSIPDFLLDGRPVDRIVTERPDITEHDETAQPAGPPRHHPVESTAAPLPPKRATSTAMPTRRDDSRHHVASGDLGPLRPYPAYKDSGIGWLQEVPAHWETVAVRRYCRVFAGATPNRAVPEYWAGGTIPWLASGDVNLRRIAGARQFITEAGHAASSTKWIRPGSLVLALAGQGRTKGMVATVEHRTTCNQSLAAIEPVSRISDHNFLAYYLESRYLDIRALVGDGLRDGLTLEHVRAIPTPLPPLSEQVAIVRFLDHADRRIRRYIRAKEEQIALLEEQKRVILHQAVTGKIDVQTGQPYPACKPSGREWLGDVPEHWRCTRLKAILARPMQNGLFKKQDEFGAGVPLVNVADVYHERFQVESSVLECVQANRAEVRRFSVQSGDILFVRSSLKLEGTGRSAIMKDCTTDTVFECHLVLARPDERLIDPRYLVMQLNSSGLRHYLISRANVVTMATVAQPVVSSCPVVVPSRAEQDTIVKWVDAEWTRIAHAMEHTNDEVSLLREYRTRLVADAVAGELNVREAAAALPEIDPLAADEIPKGGEEGDNPRDSRREAVAADRDEFGILGRDAGGGAELPEAGA